MPVHPAPATSRVFAAVTVGAILLSAAIGCGRRSAERVLEGVTARVAAHEIDRKLDQRDREKAREESESRPRRRRQEDSSKSAEGVGAGAASTADGR